MEYAWGYAASRRPFPGDFHAARLTETVPASIISPAAAPSSPTHHFPSPSTPISLSESPNLTLKGSKGTISSTSWEHSPAHRYCSCDRILSSELQQEPLEQRGERQGQAPSTWQAPSVSQPTAATAPPGPLALKTRSVPCRPLTLPTGSSTSAPALQDVLSADALTLPGKPGHAWQGQQDFVPRAPLRCTLCNKPRAPADSDSLPLPSTSTPSVAPPFLQHRQSDSVQDWPPPHQLSRHPASHPSPPPPPAAAAAAPLSSTVSLPSRRLSRKTRNRFGAPVGVANPNSSPLDSTSHSTPISTLTSNSNPAAFSERERTRLAGAWHHHAARAMAGSDASFHPQSLSATTSLSGRTLMSTNDLTSVSKDGDSASTASLSRPKKPFVTKSNGRTYLADPTLIYPLPVDLTELHRQSLRTLLLFQLFGGPVCSPVFANRPPTRVLEVGCGYGFWSMMCHSYFSRKGHSNVHFTGVDIAPLGGIGGIPNPGNLGPPSGRDRGSATSASGNWAEQPPDRNMRWNFVQHDIRNLPVPFEDEEFDLIMLKDTSLILPTTEFQVIMDEWLRVLKPGGVLEVWDTDHPIRMLRPHVPESTPTTASASKDKVASNSHYGSSAANGGESSSGGGSGGSNNSNKKAEYEKEIAELGAYVLGNNTPLSGPQNIYLMEYNSWILKFLESKLLLNWPCTSIGPFLLQEPLLTNHGSKRLAIPLTEVRWEREGVGGVVTKDGKSYIDTGKAVGRANRTSSSEGGDADRKGRTLSASQLALRQTALETVLGFIEAMEPSLREISGKKQDEWDAWMGKLMKELLEKDGANCGECLEVGAWWSRKIQNPS